MRKLIILVLVVAAIIAATTCAAGTFGHGGLMRADIGKWMHDQVQVFASTSVLAPITKATLQVFPSWQGADEQAPATSVWQVASTVRSMMSYLMKSIQVIALIGIWRRRRVAGGQGLTLIAQLRSAFRFLNRSPWYRVAMIVS
jgi:hypothetical protein